MNLYARLTVRESSSSGVGRCNCRFSPCPLPAKHQESAAARHVGEEQSRPRVRWLYATRQRLSDLLHAVVGARQEPGVVGSLLTAWLVFLIHQAQSPLHWNTQLYVCRISHPTFVTPLGGFSRPLTLVGA